LRASVFLAATFALTSIGMAQTTEFKPGQVWTYRGALVPSSRMIVGAIDKPDNAVDTEIVSISITDAPIDPKTGGEKTQTVPHLPVAADALEKSVLELQGTAQIPDGFDEGYRIWREAFETGRGGFFTITVDEIVQVLQNSLSSREPENAK